MRKAGGTQKAAPRKKSRDLSAVSPTQIYEQLRQRIATRVYPPGMRLSESELATEFGLSRTPVRQALQRLATDGLVSIKNGVGVTVTVLDRAEIESPPTAEAWESLPGTTSSRWPITTSHWWA